MDEVQDTWEMLFLQPITLKFMIYDIAQASPDFNGNLGGPMTSKSLVGFRV